MGSTQNRPSRMSPLRFEPLHREVANILKNRQSVFDAMSRTCTSLVILSVVCLAGCREVTWRNYHGPQQWATGPGFSSETDDRLPIYEGLPDRPYDVLGIVEATGKASWMTVPSHRDEMHSLIREHGGNGMIIVGCEITCFIHRQDGVRFGYEDAASSL